MGLSSTSFGPTIMNDSSGNPLNALNKTATFDTDWYSTGGCSRIGIIVSATVTSGTADIDFELSPDGGTTVLEVFPDGANSQTQADMAQITATGVTAIWHEVAFPQAMRWRLEVTLATTPDIDFTIWMYGIE